MALELRILLSSGEGRFFFYQVPWSREVWFMISSFLKYTMTVFEILFSLMKAMISKLYAWSANAWNVNLMVISDKSFLLTSHALWSIYCISDHPSSTSNYLCSLGSGGFLCEIFHFFRLLTNFLVIADGTWNFHTELVSLNYFPPKMPFLWQLTC